MSIKERIGQRIKDERTALGLTRKALASLTENLSVSRINNYERGDRTPGPEEIKELANALEVAPAYLMCLSDNKEGKLTSKAGIGSLLPVLDYEQAATPESCIDNIKNDTNNQKVDFIPVSPEIVSKINDNAFAIRINDASMSPEIRPNDIVVVLAQTEIKPGEHVVAKLDDSKEIIIRKYKQISALKNANEFNLIALNDDWADIHVTNKDNCQILGVIVQLIRDLTKFS